MNDKLKLLTEKKQQLDALKPLPKELVKNLEEWFRTELTYSSNAIEGNTLTRIETAEVIEKGVSATVSGRSLREQLEAVNHAKALEFIKALATKRKGHQFITEQDILDIHKIILTSIDDDWAGKYRQTQVFIRGTDVELPLPHKVPYLMAEFIQWLQGQQEGHPVRLAADAHFRLVSIHPFIDGNGRTARLLMNLILLIHGYPMAVIRNEERTAYINAVNLGQTKKNLTPFYDIVETSIERSLDTYIKAAKGEQPAFPTLTTTPPVKASEPGKLLKIGELAKMTNETVHTLRYWTLEGLLEAVGHTEGGYLLYPPTMIERAKEIRRLQNQERLTLNEIKEKFTSNKATRR